MDYEIDRMKEGIMNGGRFYESDEVWKDEWNGGGGILIEGDEVLKDEGGYYELKGMQYERMKGVL